MFQEASIKLREHFDKKEKEILELKEALKRKEEETESLVVSISITMKKPDTLNEKDAKTTGLGLVRKPGLRRRELESGREPGS